MKCKEPLGPRLLSVHNLQHYLDLMRAARGAIEAGRYAAFAKETLEAIDRHEHDASARSPGRRVYSGRRVFVVPSPRRGRGTGRRAPAPGPARFQFVTTRDGAPAVVDREVGEVMHPVIGPAVESERLYVAQSRLAARLAEAGGPLVLFDVGLGAGSNALAAWRCLRSAAGAGAGRWSSSASSASSAPSRWRSLRRAITRLGISAPRTRRRRARSSPGRHASAADVVAAPARRGAGGARRRARARRPRLLGPLLAEVQPGALDPRGLPHAARALRPARHGLHLQHRDVDPRGAAPRRLLRGHRRRQRAEGADHRRRRRSR